MNKTAVTKKLNELIPDDPDSFLIVDIGSASIDAIQAKRNKNGTYHVEILFKGGNPKVFNGNRIFSNNQASKAEAALIFYSVMDTGEASREIMQSFKETTKEAYYAIQ